MQNESNMRGEYKQKTTTHQGMQSFEVEIDKESAELLTYGRTCVIAKAGNVYFVLI